MQTPNYYLFLTKCADWFCDFSHSNLHTHNLESHTPQRTQTTSSTGRLCLGPVGNRPSQALERHFELTILKNQVGSSVA